MLKRQRFRFLSNKAISIIFIALNYQSPFRAFSFFLFDNCQKSRVKPSEKAVKVFLRDFSSRVYGIFTGFFDVKLKNCWKPAENLKSSRLWRDFFSRNHVPFRGLQKQKASQAVFGGASWPLKLRVCPRAWKPEKVKPSKSASDQPQLTPASSRKNSRRRQSEKTVEKTQFLSSSGVDFSPNQRHHYTRSRKGQGFNKGFKEPTPTAKRKKIKN